MGIIAYILLGVVLGVICYLAVKHIPMPPPWPTAIPVMAAILWVLLGVLYVLGGVQDVPMPRMR